MTQPWCLVTPASRGIGFELARVLLQKTSIPVVATTRAKDDSTKEQLLQDLDKSARDRLDVKHVDVTDEGSIEAAAKACEDRFQKHAYLHLAFCVPGILHPEKSPSQIDATRALDTFRINSLGPLLVTKHFSKFLPRKATQLAEQLDGLPPQAVWANMSARVGSITDNQLGGWYSYRSSKAAVNQMTKTFDNYLRTSAREKAVCVSLHPGTVKTGLSKEFWGTVKPDSLFSPAFAAERLWHVVSRMGVEGRGKCWDWAGKEIPP